VSFYIRDPGIAEVVDARKRGAGLKTQFLREIMALKIREQVAFSSFFLIAKLTLNKSSHLRIVL
jgi:hypothetical protein